MTSLDDNDAIGFDEVSEKWSLGEDALSDEFLNLLLRFTLVVPRIIWRGSKAINLTENEIDDFVYKNFNRPGWKINMNPLRDDKASPPDQAVGEPLANVVPLADYRRRKNTDKK